MSVSPNPPLTCRGYVTQRKELGTVSILLPMSVTTRIGVGHWAWAAGSCEGIIWPVKITDSKKYNGAK